MFPSQSCLQVYSHIGESVWAPCTSNSLPRTIGQQDPTISLILLLASHYNPFNHHIQQCHSHSKRPTNSSHTAKPSRHYSEPTRGAQALYIRRKASRYYLRCGDRRGASVVRTRGPQCIYGRRHLRGERSSHGPRGSGGIAEGTHHLSPALHILAVNCV